MFNNIQTVSLSKFNNAEYASLMQRFSTCIQVANPSNLGIELKDFEDFKILTQKMSDSIGKNRGFKETVEIAAIDKKADSLIKFIFNIVRTSTKFPSEDISKAANNVYNVLKCHKGCNKLPYREQLEQMRSLLMDIDNGNLLLDLHKLNLDDSIQELRETIIQYEDLLDKRTYSKLTSSKESGRSLRNKMNIIYQNFCTKAFVTSVSTPTKESADFIVAINYIIDECQMAYNHRSSKKTKPKEVNESP